MSLTEEQAKTKWCPFAKRAPYGSKSDADEIAAQGIDPEYIAEMAAQFPCIGSACMAWREITAAFEIKSGERAQANRAYVIGTLEQKPCGGFCGLAGKP